MKRRKEKMDCEEWYFKIMDAEHENMLAFTIRNNRMGTNSEGILQLERITNGERMVSTYSIYEMTNINNGIKIGNSSFTTKGIELNVDEAGLKITGQIAISQLVNIKKSLLKPGIMGIYRYIPFLEFYFEMLALNSTVAGEIHVNNEVYHLDGGSCYIQKQWGERFPNIWLWSQSSGFSKHKDSAVMIAVARLKICFNYYTAFAVPVYYNDQVEVFSNYNGGQIAKLYRYKGYVHLIITQKDKLLDLRVYGSDESSCIASKETHGIRDIYECNNVKMEVKLSQKGRIIFEDNSLYCAMQMGGNTSKLK